MGVPPESPLESPPLHGSRMGHRTSVDGWDKFTCPQRGWFQEEAFRIAQEQVLKRNPRFRELFTLKDNTARPGKGVDFYNHTLKIEVKNVSGEYGLRTNTVRDGVVDREGMDDREATKLVIYSYNTEVPAATDLRIRHRIFAWALGFRVTFHTLRRAVRRLRSKLTSLYAFLLGQLFPQVHRSRRLKTFEWGDACLSWLFEALRSGFHRLLDRLRPSGSSPYLPVTPHQSTNQGGRP